MNVMNSTKRIRFRIEPLEERIAPKRGGIKGGGDGGGGSTVTPPPSDSGTGTIDSGSGTGDSNPFDPNYYDFGGWSSWG